MRLVKLGITLIIHEISDSCSQNPYVSIGSQYSRGFKMMMMMINKFNV